jgi:hypothetical protein
LLTEPYHLFVATNLILANSDIVLSGNHIMLTEFHIRSKRQFHVTANVTGSPESLKCDTDSESLNDVARFSIGKSCANVWIVIGLTASIQCTSKLVFAQQTVPRISIRFATENNMNLKH